MEQTNNDQTSNQYLTGNQSSDDRDKKETKYLTSKCVEESSQQSNQVKNVYKRFPKGFFSLAFIIIC